MLCCTVLGWIQWAMYNVQFVQFSFVLLGCFHVLVSKDNLKCKVNWFVLTVLYFQGMKLKYCSQWLSEACYVSIYNIISLSLCPDMTLCGWPGIKHQVSLSLSLSLRWVWICGWFLFLPENFCGQFHDHQQTEPKIKAQSHVHFFILILIIFKQGNNKTRTSEVKNGTW